MDALKILDIGKQYNNKKKMYDKSFVKEHLKKKIYVI